MRLIQKSIKLYLIFSMVIFAVSVPVFFYLVQYLWIKDVDETLMFQKENIVNGITSGNLDVSTLNHFTRLSSYFDIGVTVTPVRGEYSERDSLYDNEYYDSTHKHVEPFRELMSLTRIKGRWYRINVRKDLVEGEDLMRGIVIAQAILFLLFVIGILLQSHYFSKKTWAPFYFLVTKLAGYKIDSEKKIETQPSDIDEFCQLNRSVEQLTVNNVKIFKAQKEFTENAAHEMRTPLAVIKNQVDLLAQDENTNDNHGEIINRIDKQIRLLTKLNRNLLLLTRIDNNQFGDYENVDLSKLIAETYETFREQLSLNGITCCTDISMVSLKTNYQLTQLLINNLFNNAIKHNSDGGSIMVTLNNKSLIIINSGIDSPLQNDRIFERFYKQPGQAEGTGLGLAIAKRICDSLGFGLKYDFIEPGKHSFKVIF